MIMNGRLNVKARESEYVIGAGYDGGSQGTIEILGGIFSWKPNDESILNRRAVDIAENPDVTLSRRIMSNAKCRMTARFSTVYFDLALEWFSSKTMTSVQCSGSTAFGRQVRAWWRKSRMDMLKRFRKRFFR